MGALAMAGRHPPGGPRYALPAVLVAGWAGLFAYCAVYLTEDLPFRPPQTEPASVPDALTRRVVVLATPEPETVTPIPAVRDSVESPRAVEAARDATRPAAMADLPPAARSARAVAPGPDYVGVWGPNAAACGTPSRRRGYIPATITHDRARAGRTRCDFRDTRRQGNTWIMAAECADRGRRWSSQVRLVVEGDRLTWSSDRGASAYVRCSRRAG